MSKLRNIELVNTIRFLEDKSKEQEAPIWKVLAEKLGKTNSKRRTVNISQINRHVEEGETLTVPGKVLGAGKLEHKVSVAAFSFSADAKKKIEAAGGECLTFSELVKKNPKGKDLRIIE